MVIDGVMQEIDEDLFDKMAEAIHQPINEEKPLQRSRWREDGSYDDRPLDPNYFRKYYKNNLSIPFKCPDCGRTISSKSNLSKHQKTNVCINNR